MFSCFYEPVMNMWMLNFITSPSFFNKALHHSVTKESFWYRDNLQTLWGLALARRFRKSFLEHGPLWGSLSRQLSQWVLTTWLDFFFSHPNWSCRLPDLSSLCGDWSGVAVWLPESRQGGLLWHHTPVSLQPAGEVAPTTHTRQTTGMIASTPLCHGMGLQMFPPTRANLLCVWTVSCGLWLIDSLCACSCGLVGLKWHRGKPL